jgi:hypothetical protein
MGGLDGRSDERHHFTGNIYPGKVGESAEIFIPAEMFANFSKNHRFICPIIWDVYKSQKKKVGESVSPEVRKEGFSKFFR